MSKMYIGIRKGIPNGHAINCAAHASLICYLSQEECSFMNYWLEESFKKVTCKITDEQFERMKSIKGAVVIKESALNDLETAVAIPPYDEYDDADWAFLKSLKLWN